MKKTVVLVSDLHGNFPKIPPCDLLLIAGDITPNSHLDLQEQWLNIAFYKWLNEVPAKDVVGIAGNHDFIFEKRPHLVPKMRWHYLQDEMKEVGGFKIYGTPWQPRFYDWAFNLDEPELAKKFSLIPEGVDIVISHGPPFGLGDEARKHLNWVDYERRPKENVGSPSLLNRILKVRPLLHVFGHIHEGRGEYEKDGIKFINATIVDRMYRPVHSPFVLEMETR